jgi:hypothetical protein
MSDVLVIPVQVAALHPVNRTLAAIPHGASPIILEIGVSDRNTGDVELLPHFPAGFLVGCEPLLDKFAKGLSRYSGPGTDKFVELGHHHKRGILLPLAVGPTSAARGEAQDFHVHADAGCSSLHHLNRRRDRHQFGQWCKGVQETRRVWVVPLCLMLDLIGRPLDYLKIDSQGADLAILQSGGPQLASRVRLVSLEVVADECEPLYDGQPQCSQVVAAVRALGFEPISPVHCRLAGDGSGLVPNSHLLVDHHFCELDILMTSSLVGASPSALPAAFVAQHDLGPHACDASYPADEHGLALQGRPPEDVIVAMLSTSARGGANVTGRVLYASMVNGRRWQGSQFAPHFLGRKLLCPEACFRHQVPTTARSDGLVAQLNRNASKFNGRCPWRARAPVEFVDPSSSN